MHALGAYLHDELTERGWTGSELARRSGVSKQSISNLMADRPFLGRLLHRETVEGLARALDVPVEELVMKSAEAMGIPVPPPPASAEAARRAPATLEDVMAFMGDHHLPDGVLLDYLERCLSVADKITKTLLEHRAAEHRD